MKISICFLFYKPSSPGDKDLARPLDKSYKYTTTVDIAIY